MFKLTKKARSLLKKINRPIPLKVSLKGMALLKKTSPKGKQS